MKRRRRQWGRETSGPLCNPRVHVPRTIAQSRARSSQQPHRAPRGSHSGGTAPSPGRLPTPQAPSTPDGLPRSCPTYPAPAVRSLADAGGGPAVGPDTRGRMRQAEPTPSLGTAHCAYKGCRIRAKTPCDAPKHTSSCCKSGGRRAPPGSADSNARPTDRTPPPRRARSPADAGVQQALARWDALARQASHHKGPRPPTL